MYHTNSIMTAIAAALDTDTDDEFLIDDIASRVRPRPWALTEDRLRL